MHRLLFLLVLPLFFLACDSSTNEGDAEVTIEEIEVGTGEEAERGDRVIVRYEGRLEEDNTVFDSSDRAEFGLNEVIPGFRDGIIGMREGGRRVITIPPELGYGSSGIGSIPPNATLIFDVTLLEVL